MFAEANSTTEGPDEFAITTNRPLEEPQTYAALPSPNTGGFNRADVDPRGAASEALGGRRVVASGLATASPLLSHTTRFGYVPDIRRVLAEEDLAFRKRNKGRPVERLFGVNVYFDAYERMSLDQHAELERMRRLGIATPAAPPEQFLGQ